MSFTPKFYLLALFAACLCGCSPSPKSNGTLTEKAKDAPAEGRFVNVTEQSGVAAFTHSAGESGRKYFIEQMGSGVAVLDFDGDGWMDIYFCSGAPLPGYKGEKPRNALFRNRQDGTFEDVTLKAGVASERFNVGVAVGDYDNDGRPDLYLCGYRANILYHNEGNGTFRDVTAQAKVGQATLSSSAAWGDYDGDGYLDLYMANYVVYSLEKDLNCTKFAGHKSYCGPNLYDPEKHTLYHNNGDGTFTDVSEKAGIHAKKGNGLGVVWLDYDDDNRPDIFVANDQSPNFLWHNEGGGKFKEVGFEMGVAFGEQGHAQAGMGVDAGDYDGDGKLDVLVTNFSEESNALFHNQDRIFRDLSFPTGMGAKTLMYLGFGTGFIDYDRDGWLDLFFANGHVLDDIEMYSDSVTWKQANLLFRSKQGKTFEDVSALSGVAEGKRVSRGLAYGDMFNRGTTDVIINVLRDKPLFLKNDCAPKANWLQLELKASWGNPQAIGAKVWVTAGGRTMRRDVKTCGSYASSLDPRPLFGLGSVEKVDEVKIQWPSGQISTLPNPKINERLKVEEPPKK